MATSSSIHEVISSIKDQNTSLCNLTQTVRVFVEESESESDLFIGRVSTTVKRKWRIYVNEKKQKMKILHKTAKRKKDDDKSM